MGFIGYLVKHEGPAGRVLRIFLECREVSSPSDPAAGAAVEPPSISYTYAVDVIFSGGMVPCRLGGVDGVLVLKKFYKLVNSLEERAREHGHDRQTVFGSVEGWVEHLGYTRHARDFTGLREPRPLRAASETTSRR